jgi:hypothetical protein
MPPLWRRPHSAGDDRPTPCAGFGAGVGYQPSIGPLCLFLLVTATSLAGARAAECPAFPPPVVKFTPLASDLERDTSKTAAELAGTGAKPMPVGYSRVLSGATAQSISLQKMPDGTVCAALHEVEFKLGLKRRIYVARELAGDACVADTLADLEMPMVTSDDDTLARFGAAIPQTYAAEIAAIGTSDAPSEDAVKQPLVEKIMAILKNKIAPGFSREISTAAAKVDMGTWRKAPCGGATDKAFASIHAMPDDYNSGSWQALLQSQQRPTSGMGMGMGAMGMGTGMGGR